jgi:hypothetical protein
MPSIRGKLDPLGSSDSIRRTEWRFASQRLPSTAAVAVSHSRTCRIREGQRKSESITQIEESRHPIPKIAFDGKIPALTHDGVHACGDGLVHLDRHSPPSGASGPVVKRAGCAPPQINPPDGDGRSSPQPPRCASWPRNRSWSWRHRRDRWRVERSASPRERYRHP